MNCGKGLEVTSFVSIFKSTYSTAGSSPSHVSTSEDILSIEAASGNPGIAVYCDQHFAQTMDSKSTYSAEAIRSMSANKSFAAVKKPEPL